MSRIWDAAEFTDLRIAIAGDLSERRVKPWEYLPAYPDLRKMTLVRQALMVQVGGVELCKLNYEELIVKIDEGLREIMFDYPVGNKFVRHEVMKFLFRPFTKSDEYGYLIETDSIGGWFPGVEGKKECPYPLDPLKLERFIKGMDADEFVPLLPDSETYYELPSEDPKYNPELRNIEG